MKENPSNDQYPLNPREIEQKYGHDQLSKIIFYGSEAIPQEDHEQGTSMVDMIFVVEDLKKWLQSNLSAHPEDYSSFIKLLGKNPFLVTLFNRIGSGIAYNQFVPFPNQKGQNVEIKYGAIAKEDYMKDLLDWKALYLAGRAHKIQKSFDFQENADLAEAEKENRRHALKVALLLMGDKKEISFKELFTTIADISYTNDIRMSMGGEKNNKVNNIVNESYELFKEEYKALLTELENDYIQIDWNNEKINYLNDFPSIGNLLKQLPKNLKNHQLGEISMLDLYKLGENPAQQISSMTKEAIGNIVGQQSRLQLVKETLSAGLRRGVKYGLIKREKKENEMRTNGTYDSEDKSGWAINFAEDLRSHNIDEQSSRSAILIAALRALGKSKIMKITAKLNS